MQQPERDNAASPPPPPSIPPEAPLRPIARPRRWLGALVALLALAALGALAWYLTHRPAADAGGGFGGVASGARAARAGGGGGPGGAGGRGAPATTVGVATASKADIPVTLESLGTVTAAATVTVTPQVSGTLTKILFTEGQVVHAGQVIATIDPRPFQLALTQAEGQRLRDEAQLDSARVTLTRYNTLLQQDSIARQDVDTQAALVKQLEGVIVTDKANEGTARLNLGYTRITAPISGRVGLRTVDAGNLVSANSTSVGVLTQITPIDVTFAVPQDNVPQIQARLQQGATLDATALDRTRVTVLDTGHFSTLDNQIDTTTGTVKAKARFSNEKLGLFPNQFVNLRLLIDTVPGAVTVPVTALRQNGNGDFVYVLNDDHTVSLRPVKRGISTADRSVIASGLALGEKVITEGADRLRDGARVQLPGDSPASGASGGRRRASGAYGGASGFARGASGAASGGRHRHASAAADS